MSATGTANPTPYEQPDESTQLGGQEAEKREVYIPTVEEVLADLEREIEAGRLDPAVYAAYQVLFADPAYAPIMLNPRIPNKEQLSSYKQTHATFFENTAQFHISGVKSGRPTYIVGPMYSGKSSFAEVLLANLQEEYRPFRLIAGSLEQKYINARVTGSKPEALPYGITESVETLRSELDGYFLQGDDESKAVIYFDEFTFTTLEAVKEIYNIQNEWLQKKRSVLILFSGLDRDYLKRELPIFNMIKRGILPIGDIIENIAYIPARTGLLNGKQQPPSIANTTVRYIKKGDGRKFYYLLDIGVLPTVVGSVNSDIVLYLPMHDNDHPITRLSRKEPSLANVVLTEGEEKAAKQAAMLNFLANKVTL